MAETSRRNRIIAVIVAIIIILLLLIRCQRPNPVPVAAPAPAAVQTPAVAQPSAPAPDAKEPDEILTPATVQAPAQVGAGAKFSVTWTGPNNRDDYVTIVRKAAVEAASGDYRLTKTGSTQPSFNKSYLAEKISPSAADPVAMQALADEALQQAVSTMMKDNEFIQVVSGK